MITPTGIKRTFSEITSVEKQLKQTPKRWSADEDCLLRAAVEDHGAKNWKQIALRVPGRTHAQCLQRWSKVLRPGTKKGQWTLEEDNLLRHFVEVLGERAWVKIAKEVEGRSSKQCRERYSGHLDPTIRRDPYSAEEDAIIFNKRSSQGCGWAEIAAMLPGRTHDAVKIRFKTLSRHQRQGTTPPATAPKRRCTALVSTKMPQQKQKQKLVSEADELASLLTSVPQGFDLDDLDLDAVLDTNLDKLLLPSSHEVDGPVGTDNESAPSSQVEDDVDALMRELDMQLDGTSDDAGPLFAMASFI